MTKVYQTTVCNKKGNCLQACIASLFDKELNEVPNFIDFGDKWYSELAEFYIDNGFNYPTVIGFNNLDIEEIKKCLKYDGGINGYFEASVPSQTFKDGTTHAVVVDSELNIVHDVNPNELSLKLKPEDIINVIVCSTKKYHFNQEGKFIIE